MKREVTRITFNNNQKGNMLVFFVMFVIPVLSFLLMISFEVTSIYTQKRKIQDVLDDAALLAVRSFPYENHMRQVASNYLVSNGVAPEDFNIQVSQDGISIDYHKPCRLIFSRIASAFIRGRADEDFLTWTIGVFTFASPQVEDYMIVLDRSENVAPKDKTTLWGDENDWPESNQITVDNINGIKIDKRYFTQQCFNPVFNPLKEASISLYNYFGNFSLNQLGFMVAPGAIASRQVDYLLPVGAIDFNPSDRNFEILDYENSGNPMQEDCYNIAANDQKYIFINNQENSQFYVTQAQNKASDFGNNTSFQKAIWSLPAHQGFMYDFNEVLEQALNQLIWAPTLQNRRQEAEEITKTLIFLTSKLPIVSNTSIRSTVDNICVVLDNIDSDIKLNVIYTLYNNTVFAKNDTLDINNFNNFFNTLSQGTCINFSLIVANQNEDIGDKIFEYLQINRKRGHLWR